MYHDASWKLAAGKQSKLRFRGLALIAKIIDQLQCQRISGTEQRYINLNTPAALPPVLMWGGSHVRHLGRYISIETLQNHSSTLTEVGDVFPFFDNIFRCEGLLCWEPITARALPASLRCPSSEDLKQVTSGFFVFCVRTDVTTNE